MSAQNFQYQHKQVYFVKTGVFSTSTKMSFFEEIDFEMDDQQARQSEDGIGCTESERFGNVLPADRSKLFRFLIQDHR